MKGSILCFLLRENLRDWTQSSPMQYALAVVVPAASIATVVVVATRGLILPLPQQTTRRRMLLGGLLHAHLLTIRQLTAK